jgi:hypothetical protein
VLAEVPSCLGFEVLTAVSIKMTVFWVVTLCHLVEVYHRFRGTFCFHHQGNLPDDTALQPRRQPFSFSAAVYLVALGGLVVSVLATGPKVRGFKPGRGRWILRVKKSVARLPSERK